MDDLVDDPDSFSWKTIKDFYIPIRDQEIIPCSWAFAAAALISYQLKICNQDVWDFEVSAQHLIDHCYGNSSELFPLVSPKTRQETLEVLQYIEEHGVPLQTRRPYCAGHYAQKEEKGAGPKIRIQGIVPLRKDTTLADIKKILLYHPIIASIEVYDSLLSEAFPKGEQDVYVKITGPKVGGSHYLVIIGYGNQNGFDFYEVHNSWGVEWGNKGYGRILCQLVRPFAYVEEASIDVCDRSERKLMTDDNKVVQVEEYEDDDVSPTVLYDGDSTKDDPDQLFTDLAELALDYFKKKHSVSRGKFLKLVKVTSVVCNGVILTLTMTADLSGNPKCHGGPPMYFEDQTLESEICYSGRLREMKARVLYVKAFHRMETCESAAGKKVLETVKLETKEEIKEDLEYMSDNKVVEVEYPDMKVSEMQDMKLESEKPETEKSTEEENPKLMTDIKVELSESDEDDEYPTVIYDRNSMKNEPDKLFTDLAGLAITWFNADNPHMPYKVQELRKVTASGGMWVVYTLTMTARPNPHRDAKSNAPLQNFEAVISYKGSVTESFVHRVTILDPHW